jgi:hypothetical protein
VHGWLAERSGELKKILVLIVIVACIASLAFIVGCGDDEGGKGNGAGDEQGQIIDESGRKITVEESQEEGESSTVTLEGEEGEESTIEVQEEIPSEESLGAPIYPDSEYVPGSGVSSTTTSGDKKLTASGAEFTTSDDIDEVVNWYKGKLGDPMVATPEETTWMFQDQEGAITSIMVKPFEGKTKITIAKVSGDIDIDL